ncbi:MAG: TIGR02680 family protein, partial [Firmicutes bacterium]|nr:TIGR02680 family protein [Bacillota bacterium]
AAFETLAEAIATLADRLHALDTQIELLEQSQAMEQLKELEDVKARITEASKDLERMLSQIEREEKELHRKREQAQVLRRQIADGAEAAQACRSEMTELATQAELADHAVYEQGFSAGARVEPSVWTHILRDVEAHQKRVKQLRSLLVRVREQAERVTVAERAASDARKRRDEREVLFRRAEKDVRDAIVSQEDALLRWREALLHLPLTDEVFRTVLRALQLYPETLYHEVIAPIKEAADAETLSLKSRRVEIRHERSLCEADIQRLQDEWNAWQQQREPEPARSEATAQARERRRAEALVADGKSRPIVGGPLYTLCDFDAAVDEATKAMLETALHRAGLLDAWVSSSGFHLADGEEDTWITPSPEYFLPTLADYLVPTPTRESGLTADFVEDVLRTIVMDDSREDHPVRLSREGVYQIGPLSGRVLAKERAEWIGVETRRQTRWQHMQRLQADMESARARMAVFDGDLQQLDQIEANLTAEVQALPDAQVLAAVNEVLREARFALDAEIRQVDVCSETWKEAQRVLRTCQGECNGELAHWARLQTEEDCEDALNTLQVYRERAGDLKSTLTILADRSDEVKRLDAELSGLTERLTQDQLQADEFRRRARDLEHRSEVLTELVRAAGAWDLFDQVHRRKAERAEARTALDATRERREACAGDRGRSEERLRQQELELTDLLQRCEAERIAFVREWQWGFVSLPDVGSDGSRDIAGRERDVADAVTRLLRGRYDGRKLQTLEEHLRTAFVAAKNTLVEYSIEQSYDEIGDRLLIASHRDRAHTLTPAALLAELRLQEQQQRVLIDEKDRELYEHILLRSVGRAIRDKINRAEQWVAQMNRFMAERRTSSGLTLSLSWVPQAARNERELDTDRLVQLLRRSPDTLRSEEVDDMMAHFRSRIALAKEAAAEGETLRQAIHALLDYRGWFRFQLSFKKGEQPKRELTDSRFNVLSGGEKAMAMYIPLFAATDSRYKDSQPGAPRILSLDEAFAGVDEENLRDMFQLLTDMGFDYMMTSQQLWGCYDTVPALSIYEVHRPNDGKVITLIRYHWNGDRRRLITDAIGVGDREVAASLVDA